MAKLKKDLLTELELQMMQVIWRQGSSSVNAVQQGLERELAYTTVQTVLNILERKGKLTRELHGRAYVYSAAVTETKASGHALKEFIDRVFGGSSEDLVMSLIQHRHIDAKKIAKLSRKLEGGREA